LMPQHAPSSLECMEGHQKLAPPKGRECLCGNV